MMNSKAATLESNESAVVEPVTANEQVSAKVAAKSPANGTEASNQSGGKKKAVPAQAKAAKKPTTKKPDAPKKSTPASERRPQSQTHRQPRHASSFPTRSIEIRGPLTAQLIGSLIDLGRVEQDLTNLLMSKNAAEGIKMRDNLERSIRDFHQIISGARKQAVNIRNGKINKKPKA